MTDTSTTATLADLSADDAMALVRSDPTMIDAVADAEAARDKPRKTVLEAIEEVRAATAPITDPVDDYPERPLAEALSDETKHQMVAMGHARDDGGEFAVTNPAVLPTA
jgi:hypothetical protein